MSNPVLRTILLKEVRKFVERAKHSRGIHRIALIGSLTTDKRLPKDADVLVTVDDEVDLKSLAAIGRRFQGASQSHASGADIFLCNLSGEYIGRTCSWRECHPRVACTGKSCGIRLYLRDDLEELCLAPELIKEPPIELWPEVRRRVSIPDDVEELLLGPIEACQT